MIKLKRFETPLNTPQVLHPDKELPIFSSFQVVTDTEVLKFIKESPSKTCSLDPCPTHIVKQCIDILLPSLTKLVNLCIKNEIHLSLSKGMPTALVLLDLSAAFDTIDHDTLLSCLSSRFGFAGSALKWFRSYLQDRFQSVKIGCSLSNLFKLKFGIPQGSVLGPLLFSLYTTPLGKVIRKYTGVRYHLFLLARGICRRVFEELSKCKEI